MKIYDIKIKKPKEGKRVLLYNAEDGKWVIGSIYFGLSMEDRNKLEDIDGRKKYYKFGDQAFNNHTPYQFSGECSMSYFGQYITHWCELPKKLYFANIDYWNIKNKE